MGAIETIKTMNDMYFLNGSLEAIRGCIKENCITEWGKWSLEEEVKCKGTPPLLSLYSSLILFIL